VAPCPANANAREIEARVQASSSTINILALAAKTCSLDVRTLRCRKLVLVRRQLDDKCCAAAGFAGDADSSPMVAHNGLNYCQTKAGAALLACVVRSE